MLARMASLRREGQQRGRVPCDGLLAERRNRPRSDPGDGSGRHSTREQVRHASGCRRPSLRRASGCRRPSLHCHASADGATECAYASKPCSVREEGAHMLAHPAPNHGAARSEYGGDGWSRPGERDSTQARDPRARRDASSLAIDF